MTEDQKEQLEAVDATMACWRVYGLERDFSNRPKEGWHAATALTAEPDAQLKVTIGEIPEHVIEGVKGRWVHSIYMLENFGNQFAGKTSDEVQELLNEVDTDKAIQRLKGSFNLWLTVEACKKIRIKIHPGVRFRWLADAEDYERLENFVQKMEPYLDAAFVRLLPSLDAIVPPVALTTPRTFPYLIVAGRATFGLPGLTSKGGAVTLSTSGWERIDFQALRASISEVATGDGLPMHQVLSSPHQWLMAAMEQEDDSLRSFVLSFVGLEVLTNKFGKKFEKEIVGDLSVELSFDLAHLTWPSPRDADSPWRNLVFRFALMAVRLNRQDADADIQEFKDLADIRNGMAHGSSALSNVNNLPGHRGITLLRKYIGLVCEVSVSTT